MQLCTVQVTCIPLIIFSRFTDDSGFPRTFDGPSLVPSQNSTHLSPAERFALEEEWKSELARV